MTGDIACSFLEVFFWYACEGGGGGSELWIRGERRLRLSFKGSCRFVSVKNEGCFFIDALDFWRNVRRNVGLDVSPNRVETTVAKMEQNRYHERIRERDKVDSDKYRRKSLDVIDETSKKNGHKLSTNFHPYEWYKEHRKRGSQKVEVAKTWHIFSLL